MRKVTEDYSPEISRQKLDARFAQNPVVADRVKKMTKTQLSVFAALCDGKSFTTAGYSIDADYGVNRASAVALSLEKRHSIPVSRRMIETKADVGGNTKQALFFISSEDLSRLDDEPETLFKECQLDLFRRTSSQAQRDVKRLLRELGTDGLLNLVHAANDGTAPEQNAG